MTLLLSNRVMKTIQRVAIVGIAKDLFAGFVAVTRRNRAPKRQ